MKFSRYLIILLLICNSLVAQYNGKDKFYRITSDDGLSQSWVRCIHQDKYGFMWFGTKDGLNKYDGYQFKIYRNDPDDTTSISNNTINDILEEPDGDMLICTDFGVCRYIRNKDYFIAVHELPEERINCCLKDSSGNYWFGSEIGLYRYNRHNRQVIKFENNPDKDNSLSNSSVVALMLDSRQYLWIGTKKGLDLYMPQKGTFQRYMHTDDPGAISGDQVNAIAEDLRGNIWVGTSPGALDLFTNAAERPKKGIFKKVYNASVIYIFRDHEGKFWVGRGSGQGLDVFDPESYYKHDIKIEHFDYNPDNPNSLNDNSIDNIYQDKWGDIWIGTYGRGISFLSQRAKSFYNVSHSVNHSSSIMSNRVNCFYDDNKYFWVGTESGLNRYDKITGKRKNFTHDPTDPKSIGANGIYDICKDSRGNLWIGTWGGGLNLYNYATQGFTKYQHNKNRAGSISNNNIFTILNDKKGNLWIGTIGGGLDQFNYNTKTFKYYNISGSPVNDPQANYIDAMCQTSDGSIWISTYNSLNKFVPDSGVTKVYRHGLASKHNWRDGDLVTLFEDSRKNLWLGTEGGLDCFDPSTGTFIYYSTKDGLPNNTINSIEEDDRGNLWLGTNNGISKFIIGTLKPSRPQFKNYNALDGLQGNEFVKRSAYKSKNGMLFFGGTNGYTYFYPDSIKDNTVIPPLVITQFRIFNKIVTPNEKNSPLTKDISVTHSITLNYRQSVISFKYAALNYLTPGKNLYAYMMAGFENHWNYVGSQRTATYTNLDPGEYTFRLKGSNNDGVWNNEGISIHIIIQPPFWKTTWFRIALLLTISLMLYSIYLLRVQALKSQKRLLEEKVHERTAMLSEANQQLEEKQEEISLQNEELAHHRENLETQVKERTLELEMAKSKAEEADKLKSAFLANMSHEIRTPMNAIVGFANLLREEIVDDPVKVNYLDIINNNCEALLVLINDILEISLIEANQTTIIKSEFEVMSIMEELENYYTLKQRKSLSIEFIRIKGISSLYLYNDVIRFRQVISNLMNNALKYTEKGHIHFGFTLEKDYVKFYVKDTGIGIPGSEFENIFNYFHKIEDQKEKFFRGAGIGLSISKKLTQLMGGDIWVESEIGKGTTFFFTLPYLSVERNTKSRPKEKQQLHWNLSDVKVLVAEDDPTNFQLIKSILTPTKATIIHAQDGEEAINYVRDNDTSGKVIILMDIKMPKINGIDALKAIRAINPDLPVIAVTAYAQAHEKGKILESNFDDYLAKPLKPVELMEKISRFY